MQNQNLLRGIFIALCANIVLLAFLLGRTFFSQTPQQVEPPATAGATAPVTSGALQTTSPDAPTPAPDPTATPTADITTGLQRVRASLQSAHTAIAGGTTKNHGGYVERATAEVAQTLNDVDTILAYAASHPEVSHQPRELSNASKEAAARVLDHVFPSNNNQGHIVSALTGLQAALRALDEIPGGNLGGNRDKLIADIDIAATDVIGAFDFLQSGQKTPQAQPVSQHNAPNNNVMP